ncbi:MAG: exodeoxyribonuclease VII small subunit [Thermoflavifilum sp.]|nr:exodeoxyribonuclease VII small subunit [Thermoflavifilum sp.]
METPINYTKAFEELQQIVESIERGEITLDELSHQVKRAAYLIQICKQKLIETEQEVEQVFKTMEEDKKPAHDASSTGEDQDDLPF